MCGYKIRSGNRPFSPIGVEREKSQSQQIYSVGQFEYIYKKMRQAHVLSPPNTHKPHTGHNMVKNWDTSLRSDPAGYFKTFKILPLSFERLTSACQIVSRLWSAFSNFKTLEPAGHFIYYVRDLCTQYSFTSPASTMSWNKRT